jgi:hypothetical protein
VGRPTAESFGDWIGAISTDRRCPFRRRRRQHRSERNRWRTSGWRGSDRGDLHTARRTDWGKHRSDVIRLSSYACRCVARVPHPTDLAVGASVRREGRGRGAGHRRSRPEALRSSRSCSAAGIRRYGRATAPATALRAATVAFRLAAFSADPRAVPGRRSRRRAGGLPLSSGGRPTLWSVAVRWCSLGWTS